MSDIYSACQIFTAIDHIELRREGEEGDAIVASLIIIALIGDGIDAHDILIPNKCIEFVPKEQGKGIEEEEVLVPFRLMEQYQIK